MSELFGAVIATSLVLMAVFVPVAFFPGTTGALYKQFALTIAFSIAISTFLALTLTPPSQPSAASGAKPAAGLAGFLIGLMGSLTGQDGISAIANFPVRFKGVVIGLFICPWANGLAFLSVPQAFLPEEDQGYFITIVQGPEGVSLNYTSDVMNQVEQEILKVPEVSELL
jgi:HAE1 family hydrophobic/amphiphilic exporter-1